MMLQRKLAGAEESAAAAEAARREAEAKSTALQESCKEAAEAAAEHALELGELQSRIKKAEAELAATSSSAQVGLAVQVQH